jgi:putative transposase
MSTITRVESHIFKNNKELDKLCFKSKNLYNSGLYLFKQTLLNENRWLFYSDFVKHFTTTDVYKELPAQVAQQTLRMLDKNIKSYIRSIKDWSKNKSKYKGQPALPYYLDSKSGRFVYINPGQSISRKGDTITLLKKVFKFKTKIQTDWKINEVRIVPKLGYHKVEVVYQKPIQSNDTKITTRFLGIDLGLDNLMSITNIDTNRPEALCNKLLETVGDMSDFSILVKGTQIKSFNQFYNKQLAQIKSVLKIVNNKHWSKKLSILTLKRNQKIEDYLHKASRTVIDLALQFQIGTIVIGHNKDWKQKIELGKRNNQNFVGVPLNKLIQMIQYKAEEVDIKVIVVEESYTSKIDHLAKEPMKKQENYLGKRIKRGLFQSSVGKLINADINGAIGILRKVVDDDFLGSLINRGDVFSPIKLSI